MTYIKTLVLILTLVLVTGCPMAEADDPVHTSSLTQWEVIFLTQTTITRLTPADGNLRTIQDKVYAEKLKEQDKGVVKELPTGFYCDSANNVINMMVCGSGGYLVDLETNRPSKRKIPFYGTITADGRYILKRSENSSVYDIQTDTTFPLEPIPRNEEGERPSVAYPTQPRPDGTFAFSFSDTDDYDSNIIYEANFNEVLEKRGQGFSFTRVEDALQNGRLQSKIQDYIGNNLSMEIKVRFDSPPPLNDRLENWPTPVYSCTTSHDGEWAVCKSNDDWYGPGWVLVDTRAKKVVKEYPDLAADTNPLWMWTGDPKKHPGYVR